LNKSVKKRKSVSKSREKVVLNNVTTKRLYKASRDTAKKIAAKRLLQEHHEKYHVMSSKPTLSKGTKELLKTTDASTSGRLSMAKNLPPHQRYDADRKNREARLQQLQER
jgi:hypothetical protein